MGSVVLVSKLDLASAKIEDSSQCQKTLRRDVPWRGHASGLPLDLDLQKLLVMLLTDPPQTVVVLLEEQRLESRGFYVFP